jgi:hypothetical protein
LLIWICNRFDYSHRGSDAAAELERLPFPDSDFYDWIRYAAVMQGNRIAIAGYTDYENYYARNLQNVDVGELVLKPTGWGANVTGRPDIPLVPSGLNRASTFFLPPYHNDERMVSQCEALGLSCYRGRYAGVRDLAGFLGVLHIPYAWSNMALFEVWRAGLVYVIPSMRMLLSMQGIFWSPPYDTANLHLSEWYHQENKELFVYFDSWEELVNIAANPAIIRSRMPLIAAAMQQRRASTLRKWAAVVARM